MFIQVITIASAAFISVEKVTLRGMRRQNGAILLMSGTYKGGKDFTTIHVVEELLVSYRKEVNVLEQIWGLNRK